MQFLAKLKKGQSRLGPHKNVPSNRSLFQFQIALTTVVQFQKIFLLFIF